jgi:hypothetical protein
MDLIFVDQGEVLAAIEFTGRPALTPHQKILFWIKLTFHRRRRRYHLWLKGGVESEWVPPPFIGWSCPKWLPWRVQEFSWRLYHRWLGRTDRLWRRDLRRRLRAEEGLAPG